MKFKAGQRAKRQIKNSHPLKFLAAIFVVILAFISVVEWISYKNIEDELITGQAQRALDHAQLVAESFTIDQDEFDRIKAMPLSRSRIQSDTLRFKEIAAPIIRLEGIRYIYIISRLDESAVLYHYDDPAGAEAAGYPLGTAMNAVYVFTSEDESGYEEIDRYDYNFLKAAYDQGQPVMIKADNWRWKVAITGLYPYRNPDGVLLGYVGVDISIASFYHTLNHLRLIYIVLLVIIIIMLGGLYGLLANRLYYSLYRDSLTGLVNRNAYQSIMARQLELNPNSLAAFYFLDLDGFKNVNDTLGHSNGDHLLNLVARRLVHLVDRKTLVIRIAGDEFGLFHCGFADESAVRAFGDEIINDLSRQVWEIGKQKVRIAASAGCAIWKQPAQTIAQLIEYADFAMYQAKAAGKSRLTMFRLGSYLLAEKEQQLHQDLGSALLEKRYVHVFQPIYDINNNCVAGYEGFTRLDSSADPDDSVVSYAETQYQSVEIERLLTYSLAETFRQIKGDRQVFLSINESINDLYSGMSHDEFRKYEQVFAGLDIVAEINETHWADIIKVMAKAVSARSLGQRIALDNFVSGSRCSSLLVGMNPEWIKLSPDLVQNLDQSTDTQRFIILTVHFAHRINCHVVAQGVENIGLAILLRRLGVDYLQGPAVGLPSAQLEDAEPELCRMINAEKNA
ncbi:MAG: diguanylate cyclase [Clostridiaceae bacterium]|nr:diguanylate cyclase [Clostridiaceae bacterium]